MIARLLIGSKDNRTREIHKTLAFHLSGVNLNHPDLLYFQSDSKLGIEQARQIKFHLSTKPHTLKGKAVILEDASALTTEAQNALLKILEEPPREALIVLGIKSESDLIPTVLSRCQITRLEATGSEEHEKEFAQDVEKLLSATTEERFEYIEKLKDREQFLKELVFYFHQNLRSHTRCVNQTFLQELLQAEEWAKQNVNIRAILEYLMVIMPTE